MLGLDKLNFLLEDVVKKIFLFLLNLFIGIDVWCFVLLSIGVFEMKVLVLLDVCVVYVFFFLCF